MVTEYTTTCFMSAKNTHEDFKKLTIGERLTFSKPPSRREGVCDLGLLMARLVGVWVH